MADLAERDDRGRCAGHPDHGRRRALQRAAGGDPRQGVAPCRHARAHRPRLSLAFADAAAGRYQGRQPAAKAEQDAAAPPANASDRLFVTIAALGAVLAPAERLRSIYPRYVEAQATAGPDGLAFLPFRAGTPYLGEDLVYLGEQPEQFFGLV